MMKCCEKNLPSDNTQYLKGKLWTCPTCGEVWEVSPVDGYWTNITDVEGDLESVAQR